MLNVPDEVQIQLANIERSLQQYLQQANVAFLGLQSSDFFFSSPEEEEEQERLTAEATNIMENSMNEIRTQIDEEDERFPSVLRSLSLIFDRHLWRAAENIENKRTVISYGNRSLRELERRMAGLDHTGEEYKECLLERLAIMDLMAALGEANTLFNESKEALAMLNRDVDSLLNDVGSEVSQFIRGQYLNTSRGMTLFAANSIWKIRRSRSRPFDGVVNAALPSWSAFYGIEAPATQVSQRRVIVSSARAGESIAELRKRFSALNIHAPSIIRTPGEGLHCNICMETILRGQNSRRLPCGHVFHKFCVDQWLKNHYNCSTCRGPAA